MVAGASLVALAAAHPGAAEPAQRAGDGLGRALAEGRLTHAEFALERALALYRPERARRLFGEIVSPDPREGTPIFRDLAARVSALPPSQRPLARRILARPTARRDAIHGYTAPARRSCGPHFCFWWVTKGVDAPRLADRNRNRIPDWVETTRAVFARVWRTEVERLGYRRPLSDLLARDHGPNGKLDVYIADVGADGLYGYCTSDDPRRRWRRAVSAFCVVDDDFAAGQFEGTATGRRALEVTAAHEFFHAVQYAYDWLEDLWFMEGTATWIEDEVFDDVNDNRQYLRTSPLSPRLFSTPIDYYDRDPNEVEAGFKYGAWIFWRYLSERVGREVVRETWSRAAGRRAYSVTALVRALATRELNLTRVFADFGAADLYPSRSYAEGASYPVPRPSRVFAVGTTGVARTPVTVSHLANDYYGFIPDRLPDDAVATFTLELPAPAASPMGSAVVERRDGSVVQVPAAYDEASGRWRIVVENFGAIRRVVLVLTNASTRFACRRRTVYSCRGVPRDDDAEFDFGLAVSEPPPVQTG